MSKRKVLPRTSRVSEKVEEYWQKYGKDRNLEKFMFLHSPAERSDSGGATTNSNSSSPSCAKENVLAQNNFICSDGASASSKNLLIGSEGNENMLTTQNDISKNNCINSVKGTPLNNELIIPISLEQRKKSISAENVSTPDKVHSRKEAKTPESISKTNKHLEWDSMADVGYKKSMSTSNILGTLERSLLKDIFQDGLHGNPSEDQIKGLQNEQTLPPLASSTFLKSTEQNKIDKMKPEATQQTKTNPASSLKNNQSVQTSHIAKNSRSTQVTDISASGTPSYCGSSATHSSFEYRSSTNLVDHCHSKTKSNIKEYTEHFNEINKPSREDVTKCQNKESHQRQAVHSPTKSSQMASKPVSELDLGIQLLCSLVDARSLTQTQKKQLIHDIAKRISCLENLSSVGSSQLSDKASSASQSSKKQQQNICITSNEQLLESKELSTRSTESNLQIIYANNVNNATTNSGRLQGQVSPRFRTTCTSRKSEMTANLSQVQIGSIAPTVPTTNSNSSTLNNSEATTSKESITQKTNLIAVTTTTAVKKINEVEDLTTDAEQSIMREWLNPMTRSEIEYEERQSNRIGVKKQQAPYMQKKKAKTKQDDKTGLKNIELCMQLQWIENKIKRLRKLQALLNKGSDTSLSSVEFTNSESSLVSLQMTENQHNLELGKNTCTIVDQTDIEKSKKVAKERDTYIFNEKHCNKIAKNDRKELMSERIITIETKEHQDTHEASTRVTHPPPLHSPPPPPPPSLSNSTRPPLPPPHLHSVLPVPLTCCSKNVGKRICQFCGGEIPTSCPCNDRSKSVGSFVQQRKREFVEHYNKKKKHFEQLQQREQDLVQKQHNTYCRNHFHCCYHFHCYNKKAQNGMKPPCSCSKIYDTPADSHLYYQVASSGKTSICTNIPSATTSAVATSVSGNNTISTSSKFCISSDVSIQIDASNTTEGTSMTTHQYDDVTAAIKAGGNKIQTNDIINCPQFLGDVGGYLVSESNQNKAACIQARPHGIAYVIEFTDNTAKTNGLPKSASSLQDCLQRAKPRFCAQSKKRKGILNEMQLLRTERKREMDKILINTSVNSLERKLQNLPPAPSSRIRIFTTKEMKALTNRRCESLPEVVAQQRREREERQRRGNRMMRDLFNRRLQRHVRDGKISLNHSLTLL